MKGWALISLAVLACVSLAVNAALWHDRQGLMEETAKLRASVKTLSAARTADEYARSLRDNLSDEARHNAIQKQVLPGFPWVTPVRNWPGRGLDRHRRSRWLS